MSAYKYLSAGQSISLTLPEDATVNIDSAEIIGSITITEFNGNITYIPINKAPYKSKLGKWIGSTTVLIKAESLTGRIGYEVESLGDGTSSASSNTAQSVTASRSALLTDIDTILECNSASAINITIDPASTTNFIDGTLLTIYQVGVGASLFGAGAGVTIQGTAPTATQYTHIAVRKRSGDTWAWV